MHMTRRFTTAAVLVVGLALCAGACSSSDSAGGTTTTKAKRATTTTTADHATEDTTEDTTDTTLAAVSDEEFDATIAVISEQIDAAGDDACGLLEVGTAMNESELPNPSTPAQVETAIMLLTQLFAGIADSAPAEYAADSAAIRTTMADVQVQAAEKDYDPVWFNSDEFDPFADEAFATALATLTDVATKNCPVGSDTTG